MKIKTMSKRIATIAVCLILGLTACQNDRLSNESIVGPEVTRMDQLIAPPTFDWSTSRSYKLILALGDQAPMPGKYLVKIYTGSVDDPAGARFSGFIDAQNPLVTDILLPSSTEKIFALLHRPDGSEIVTEMSNAPTISHTFYSGKRVGKVSKSASISCNSCTSSLSYNGGNTSIPSSWQQNKTFCVTGGSGGNGTINTQYSGNVIKFCANNSVGTLNLGWATHLKIVDGVTLTVNTLNLNSGATLEIGVGAKLIVNNNFMPGGNITNHGTLECVKAFSPNHGITINNYCTITAGKDSENNSSAFHNYANLVYAKKLTVNNGATIRVYDGSHTKMKSLQMNGGNMFIGPTGSGQSAFLEVTGNANANNGVVVKNNIKVCRDGGNMNNADLQSGATFDCNVYIPAGTCQIGFGTPPITDSDGDGVADASDNYPNDITRAYDSFNPSENSFGTAMFEDLWPHEGDYDFNDVVVSWRQQLVSNADNKIVEAKIKVVKVARGGSLESGFGLKLGTVPSEKVASVTGCELSGFATIGANGAESGQTYANIIFWDKISQAWPNTTGASMQNTVSSNPHSTEDTTEIVVTFTEPIEGTLLNNGGPYIWVNNERGREIHPAGSAPTNLVDPSYFGTGSDNSDPNDVTTMYKGNGNRPWALVIFEETAQTEEKVDFTEAYLKFSDWALSSGGSYNDWYQDEAGYRGSSSKFYTK